MSLPTTTAQWTLVGQNGFQDLHYEESVPIPILGDHDCLIKLGAVSLNYRDLAIAKVSRAVLDYVIFHSFSSYSKFTSLHLVLTLCLEQLSSWCLDSRGSHLRRSWEDHRRRNSCS